ncbi:transmembrane amino acid transporter protein-domain-containing protein [Durotheca rogersii]|uniref:transmembrane amino acid transporter protein-domain-containing protein n=1 Tax=Durotheca rogersii TaxID=419775 RepID=UPI0022200953|nr:transmembrane amino acid transporter protein-domain-containing protein [Durotheca rogersii]KAI5864624.1 transmembrane amino acid transporter protein-domain-containing protein [Durotheca rogersii]
MATGQSATWNEHHRGTPLSRSDSLSSVNNQSTASDDQALLSDFEATSHEDQSRRARRRSSVTNRLVALTDIGGVNSIRSFGRSWQRAAAFPEIIPQQPSFVFAPDQEPVQAVDPNPYNRRDIEAGPRESLLRRDIESAPLFGHVGQEEPRSTDTLSPRIDGHGGERKHRGSDLLRAASPSGSFRSNSIFSAPPLLSTTPPVGSYGSTQSYGSIESTAYRASMIHAAELWHRQRESSANLPDGGHPPIVVKEVEQEGRLVLAVSGQSTLPQTVVNSTNVLIGIGLLSLPMGIKYAGWICGLSILLLCAAVTSWTAKLLAKCMDLDPSMITFSDIAFISFGRKARIATAVLFTLELLAACVALIVLFADSLALLLPGTLTVTEWKVLCTLAMVPLQFAPLALLSFTSFVGIVCCLGIVFIVILDGLFKVHAPGSLIEPATTYLFPANWLTLPLSFGLLMSPWGGHSVFPNIYRDMRHPHRYKEAVAYTFTFTLIVDVSIAVVGFVMFGDEVRDEITANIFQTSGYPNVLNFLLVVFISIIPLTKIPLNSQPIITTLEVICGLRQQVVAEETPPVGLPNTSRRLMKALVRILTLLVFLVIAILFPEFDAIMAFMGSALCFTICVTLPLAFYLKLFGHEIGVREHILTWSVMMLSFAISVVGTVWAFLPKYLLGVN